MCLRWRNLNELMREEYYHQQFGERRTRNCVNEGTENTERADLVNNQIINHYNQDTDNNQNVNNNNQNIDNNNQDIDHNNQDIDNNNQDIDGNNQQIDNQYVDDNKQDIDNKKQDLDDNVIDNCQIIIKIAEKSNEMASF